MNKPKITKGEWHLGKRAGAEYGAIYGEKGEEIALPLGFFSTEEEARANAKCIAAAPAMAEALEAALVGLESDILYCERHPDSHRTTHEGMLAHKRKRLNDAKAALTLAGYEF